MAVDIRLPNITGKTEREQLLQLKSYLYQLSEQLQWAFSTISTQGGDGSSSVVINQVVGATSSGDSSENTGPSFNELQSLIVKTADTVEAYYEEVTSKLVSEYVALSDFGTYTEVNEAIEKKTAQYTENAYTRIAQVETDLDVLTKATRGYIKTGIIVESLTAEEAASYGKTKGDALIGIEVGEDIGGSFTKYARFTAGRLSFYNQAGSELAYIGTDKLYIREVEIKESFQEGGYKDFIDANGGIVTKWVGGS